MKLPVENGYREKSRFNGVIRLSGDGLPSIKNQLCIYKIQPMLFKVQQPLLFIPFKHLYNLHNLYIHHKEKQLISSVL